MADSISTKDRPESASSFRRSWKWLRFLRAVVCIYLGLIVVLCLFENYLVYHPTRASQHWQPPPSDRFEDVTLKLPDGVKIHAWWCPCEEADGAILYCHGNAGNLSHRGQSVLRMQQELKQSVLIFDYPGYGRSGGSPSEKGCYAAADAAYDWLTNIRKIPGEKVLLYGGSLGGGVAVDLASRRPHRALVLAKTFTSLPDVAACHYWWVPVRWLMRNRFDNLGKIGNCRKPVIITHGTADELVPYWQGEKLFAAANEPKLFYPLDGATHNSPVPVEFLRQVRQFLTRVEETPRR